MQLELTVLLLIGCLFVATLLCGFGLGAWWATSDLERADRLRSLFERKKPDAGS